MPDYWPAGYLSDAEQVPVAMREWFTGKRLSAPYGVRFECSEELWAKVLAKPTAASDPGVCSPLDSGIVGSLDRLTGLPVVVRPDLDGGAWQLTAMIERTSPRLRYKPVMVVVREGVAEDGKPTPLDRDYWLLDLRTAIAVDPDYRSYGDGAVRNRLRLYALACGHNCNPLDIKVTRRPPKVSWESWAYFGVVSVPREPVTYPRQCGDWACQALTHWAKADPVDEPAVFAGAVAEHRYVDMVVSGISGVGALGHWTAHGPCVLEFGMREVLHEHIAMRRHQADGNPLWTIDVRPKETS